MELNIRQFNSVWFNSKCWG